MPELPIVSTLGVVALSPEAPSRRLAEALYAWGECLDAAAAQTDGPQAEFELLREVYLKAPLSSLVRLALGLQAPSRRAPHCAATRQMASCLGPTWATHLQAHQAAWDAQILAEPPLADVGLAAARALQARRQLRATKQRHAAPSVELRRRYLQAAWSYPAEASKVVSEWLRLHEQAPEEALGLAEREGLAPLMVVLEEAAQLGGAPGAAQWRKACRFWNVWQHAGTGPAVVARDTSALALLDESQLHARLMCEEYRESLGLTPADIDGVLAPPAEATAGAVEAEADKKVAASYRQHMAAHVQADLTLMPRGVRELYEQARRRQAARPDAAPLASTLFYGPSGSGKTRAVLALAAGLGLPTYVPNAALFVRWQFESVSNLERLLRGAQAEAERQDTFAIVILDEADKDLGQRGALRGDGLSLANAFLSFMDGVNTPRRSRVVFLATTNHLERMDEAARRRFAQHHVGLPDAAELAHAFAGALAAAPRRYSGAAAADCRRWGGHARGAHLGVPAAIVEAACNRLATAQEALTAAHVETALYIHLANQRLWAVTPQAPGARKCALSTKLSNYAIDFSGVPIVLRSDAQSLWTLTLADNDVGLTQVQGPPCDLLHFSVVFHERLRWREGLDAVPLEIAEGFYPPETGLATLHTRYTARCPGELLGADALGSFNFKERFSDADGHVPLTVHIGWRGPPSTVVPDIRWDDARGLVATPSGRPLSPRDLSAWVELGGVTVQVHAFYNVQGEAEAYEIAFMPDWNIEERHNPSGALVFLNTAGRVSFVGGYRRPGMQIISLYLRETPPCVGCDTPRRRHYLGQRMFLVLSSVNPTYGVRQMAMRELSYGLSD